MSETYVCSVPILPCSLNEWARAHWTRRRLLHDAFQHDLWAVLNEKDNKCPRGLERVECHAILTFTEKRRRDGENYGAVLWKWAADVLVREGVIPDDTPEHILCHTPELRVGSENQTLLLITLEP